MFEKDLTGGGHHGKTPSVLTATNRKLINAKRPSRQ